MPRVTGIDRVRRAGRRLPAPVRSRVARVVHAPRVRRMVAPARWGNLRRPRPFSRGHSDRGTPVDRPYLDRFFGDHAAAIRGRVLEVGDPRYTGRFGQSEQVERVDIVDIDPANRSATLVVDLAEAGSLPEAAFDCCVVPQTLQYVDDFDVAVENLWASLAPGGTLLVSVAAVARSVRYAAAVDRWRMLPRGLEDVLRRCCPGAEIDVCGFGNVTIATAFLHGLVVEELDVTDFAHDDPDFPVVTCGVARKAAA